MVERITDIMAEIDEVLSDVIERHIGGGLIDARDYLIITRRRQELSYAVSAAILNIADRAPVRAGFK